MSEVSEQVAEPSKPFDPTERDCFARFINRTDDGVGSLILRITDEIDRQGEYDQGDQVVLSFDSARDLATVADLLWHSRTMTR